MGFRKCLHQWPCNGTKAHYLSFLLLTFCTVLSTPRLVLSWTKEFLETIQQEEEALLKEHLNFSSRSFQQLSPESHQLELDCVPWTNDSGQRDMGWDGWLQPTRDHSWAGSTASWVWVRQIPKQKVIFNIIKRKEKMGIWWPKPANILYSWFTDGCTPRFPPESLFIYSSFSSHSRVRFLTGGSMPYSSLGPQPLTQTVAFGKCTWNASKKPHTVEWGMLPSCWMEKSIPIAAGMESLLETRSQSVSINSNPNAWDFHPTDAFCIVKHPGVWAAWIHVFAPSFITPFPGKKREPAGALCLAAHVFRFMFQSINERALSQAT